MSTPKKAGRPGRKHPIRALNVNLPTALVKRLHALRDERKQTLTVVVEDLLTTGLAVAEPGGAK